MFFVMWFKSKKKQKALDKEELQKKIELEHQVQRAKEIGIEQAKPENAIWLEKPSGIYFDGHKIIIKSPYNESLVKSIKGMGRRAWEPAIKAWICPIDEYPNVLGIAKRFDIPLNETFANMHKSTDKFIDASIPGSNGYMLRLHNEGVIMLSLKKIMKSDEGYIYLIRASDNTRTYKIGKSTTPDKRVRTVIGQMPMKCEAIHCAWFEDHGYVEKLLHDMYAKQRINSEWFRLSENDVNFIQSLGQKYDLNPTAEQLQQRNETDMERRKNYQQFKHRENRRNSKNSRYSRNKNNPNQW
jgi:hypothetical protein